MTGRSPSPRLPRPSRHARAARSAALLTASPLVAVALLAGCTGGGDEPATEGQSPEDVMAAAKDTLDETSGVRVSMSTDEDPGGDYLSEATGVIVADPPAFEGTISGRVSGFPGDDIGVVSVDGDVYIDVPLVGWTDEYQPDAFCAPDPALLLDPDTGVSSVLTAATDLSEGEAERNEDDASVVITPYTGTVPGDAIRDILPCTEGDDVEATFEIDEDGRLVTTDITGAFFPDADPVTYRISIDEYDVTADITAPR